jgi:CRISPR-associated endonuclease/helicase Cas3
VDLIDFDAAFSALTGNPPFPWQRELYKQFLIGNFPASCNLPTGLCKTSVIHIWLLALATAPAGKVPRRLVYVVNRRTVVDQSTREAEKLRERLPSVPVVSDALREKCGTKPDGPKWSPLAISTLRGQFADNREWSADPARPAAVVGTVDMIGSRLLFSGYGVGFKVKPLHAGFLGQDVLLVHDEAHLEPAFQKLLIAIQKEQHDGERTGELPWPKLRVMELSATSRGGGHVFELTKDEKNPPHEIPDPPEEPIHHVWRRLKAKKGIRFVPAQRDEVAAKIGRLARDRKATGKAILVFVRTIDDVKTVQQLLTDKKEGVPADRVKVLAGTLRGLERDRLVETTVVRRFLLKPPPDGRTAYLVCTSAGEVGVDISADHMICDLTTLDSMAQRLGRVNRRGGGAADIDVVYESDPDPKPKSPEYERARWKTLEMLRRLPQCDWTEDRQEGSPLALRDLMHADDEHERERKEEERRAAFAPLPTTLPVSDILFDAWALTTIRGKLPGRPMVEPYLHGISGWEPPETYVAWRAEVWELQLKFKSEEERKKREPEERKRLARFATDLLEDYPLKPHELLREPSYRAFKHFETLAKRRPKDPVWLLDDDGKVEVFTLAELADKDKKDRIDGKTVLLPPSAGGLAESGMLDCGSESADDVADNWFEDAEKQVPRRKRVRSDDSKPAAIRGMRLVFEIDTKPEAEEEDADNAADDSVPDADREANTGRYWRWYVRPRSADDDGSKTAQDPVTWKDHTNQVTQNATRIAAALGLSAELQQAIQLAAKFHDLGKRREVWQRSIGNPKPKEWHAKSGKGWKPLELTAYRHEFGSLVDLLDKEQPYLAEFRKLTDEMQDFVLHLIAVHHGRGRPHFPPDEAFDPEPKGLNVEAITAAVPQRFARLQRKYGRWGLAYVESLLRAADYAASAEPSKTEDEP